MLALIICLAAVAAFITLALVIDARRNPTDPANRTALRTGAPVDSYVASRLSEHQSLNGGGFGGI